MSDAHGRLVELFQELRSAPSASWTAEIARRCAAETASFRDQLLRMLHVSERMTASSSSATVGGRRTGAPARIDRYEIRDVLGEGGTAIVYLAYDAVLQREVALKALAPVDGDDGERARRALAREARLTGGLQHPGVLPVYERSAVDASTPYFTLRPLRADERRLGDRILARRGDAFDGRRDLVEAFRALCSTVAFAHERGVAHGDLKPANVAVGPHGEVVVLDWGMAQVLQGADGRCTVWARQLEDLDLDPPSGGTGAYVAPELLERGARRTVATDVYALGTVLYEVLTGALPAGRGAAAPLAALAFGDWPPDATRLDPSIPPVLARLAHRAMDRLPERRPLSAAECADEIERWQEQDARERRAAARAEDARATLAEAEAARGPLRRHLADRARALCHALREDRVDVAGLDDGIQRVLAAADRDDRDDARRRARRRRWTIAGATALGFAGVVGVLLRDRASVVAERDRTISLLREVEQLADVRTIDDLVDTAETLWPASPDAVRRMEDWLRRADDVTRRRATHTAARAALRARAPLDVEPARIDPESAATEAAERADRDDLDFALERWGGPTPYVTRRLWLEDRRRRVDAQLGAGARPPTERSAPSEEPDRWRDDVLGDIVAGLDLLEGATGRTGLVARMRSRHAIAARIAGRSDLDDPSGRNAVARAQAPGRYPRPPSRPDPALAALGPDPGSGLEEFAVHGTGETPVRAPGTGTLAPTGETAVVLVLLPGGAFVRGSPEAGAPGAGIDAATSALRADEHPAREIRVGPFFLSKYELTQGQWARLTEGERPSHEQGSADGFTDAHPVEMVAWTRANAWLRRYGLRLPSEAEWEYACRAGTVGERYLDDVRLLHRHANFADATLAQRGPEEFEYTRDQDDGHHFHAPVGSFLPNPFGLHDLYGNVSEWCQDVMDGIYYAYSRPVDPPGSTARYRIVERIHRGGTWADPPRHLRSADRRGLAEDRPSRTVGLRPAKDMR